MSSPIKGVRGIRDTLPPMTLVGRLGSSGAAQVISMKDVVNALQKSLPQSSPAGAGNDTLKKAEDYTDTKVAAANSYTDTKFTAAEAYTDTKFSDAETYTDTKFTAAEAYTDTKFGAAEAYTDAQIAAIAQYLAARPYFCADLNNVDQTGLTVPANNLIKLSHASEDNKGWFNAANNRYVPQQAGIYNVMAGVELIVSGVTSGDSPTVHIYKNGVLAYSGVQTDVAGGGTGAGSFVNGLVRMNGTTDYIQAYCFAPTNTTGFRGAFQQTYMHGFFVGP